MQNIGTYKDITWIDDAISTTPESTIQAIQTFGHQIDTIFLGGTDRGYVFDELVKQLDHYEIQNIVLFPDSGTRILSALQTHSTHERNILQTSDMQEAVKFAYTHTRPGKICLLSTASPSYSVRKNFEEKGDLFAQYIQTLSH